jgi:RNA polymerase sigma factor (sigma-70 family)
MKDLIDEPLAKLTEAVVQNERKLISFACYTLRSFGSTDSDAEDALSEAFIVAATKIRQNPSLAISNYAAWYQRILYFSCLSLAKKTRRSVLAGIDLDYIKNEYNVLEAIRYSADDDLRRNAIEFASKSLTPNQRSVLMMSLDGYTADEIAVKLDISEGNVRQLKSRAIQAIRPLVSR